MSNKKNSEESSNLLREQAEKIVRQSAAPEPETLPVARVLLHELRVHQIELEMQNSELRRIQEALAAAKDRYFDLYDLAPVGNLTLGSKGLILEAIVTFAKLLGVNRGILPKQPLSNYIRSDDQDIYYRFYNRLLKSSEPQMCELRLQRKDGAEFWAHFDATSFQEADGQEAFRITIGDISERKQAENALIENEDRFRAYFEKNKSVMLLVDKVNGFIVDANLAAASFYGYPLAQLKQMKISDINTLEWTAIARQMESAASQIENVFFFSHRLSSGEIRQVEVYSTPIRVDKQDRLLSIVHDITARTKLEKELLESETRYRELIQDANVIIVIVNGQDKITFLNEYGLSFFGYSAEELIGKSEIETIIPEFESTGRNLHKIFEDMQAKPQHYLRHTHEIITRQKRRKWVDWTNRSLVVKTTGEMGLTRVGIDVTDAKRAEQEVLYQFDRHRRQDMLRKSLNRQISQADLLSELGQTGLVMEPPFVLNLLAISAGCSLDSTPVKELAENQFHIDMLIQSIHGAKIGVACQTPAGVVVVRTLPDTRRNPVSAGTAKLATDELMKVVSRYYPGAAITAGISHSTAAALEVADLFEQAGAALTYGPVITPGLAVYHWNDLGCYQFVVKDLQSAQVRQFIEDHLGPILSEKLAEKRAAELATLEALLSGDSIPVIADRLHVHKQTIAFRKKKLEDKMGVDLDALSTRVNLAMALKMHQMS